ncbi:MAG: phosphoglycerate dehydrogenase [Mycobacteriales bacterium]
MLVAEELAPSALEVLSADFDVRHVDGTDRAALLAALADARAVIVRSATRIDAEALAAGTRLQVVARAGVGLDNVDVAAATARGVMVVNAPLSNIVSAAEHAVALLLAVARRVPAANASLKSGHWSRSAFTGVELVDKTVGVIGLGRIGALFAARMSAFGTRLLAYDPYVSQARAAALGVTLTTLAEVLKSSDFISIHLPKTPETVKLIGEEELALCKPGAIIVNAARGGLLDEHALAQALKEGRLGGAGLDVFENEPTTDSPLFAFDCVVVTPHLGAATAEAQDKAGLAVARSVKAALAGEFVADAVNVSAAGIVPEDVRPVLPLAETLGRVFTCIAAEIPTALTVEVRGEIADQDVSVVKLAALRGVFAGVVEEPVTFVNASRLAEQRGLEVILTTASESPDHRNLLILRGTLANHREVSVSGTLAGPRQVAKLTGVNGFDLELAMAAHMLFFEYHDRPGVVGTVGNLLGAAGVNIAGMQVSRRSAGGAALMALDVDSSVTPPALAEIARAIGAGAVHAVDLADR